jgi:hypothetical protein
MDPIGAVEAIETIEKKDSSVQTDKKQITEKQREALKAGRELYAKNKVLYKAFVAEQSAKQKTEPVRVVQQERGYSIAFI